MEFTKGRNQWRKPAGKSYKVLFAGDTDPRMQGEELTANGHSDKIMKEIKPVFDAADCRIIQWETAVTEAETPIDKSGPNLKIRPACLSLLNYLGVDIALLANNHVGDYGPEAVNETIRHLTKNGQKTVGAGKDLAAALKPLKFKLGNIPVTLINLCENEFGGAREDRAGTATMQTLRDLAAVREAKSAGGLVFVALHGGHETNPFPSPRMSELFRALIDAGADLVWNCHTHCPEGIELWNGKPIVYSPGNFYFPPRYAHPSGASNCWWCGYMVQFEVDAEGVSGLSVIPYQQYPDHVSLLKGERYKKFFDYMKILCEPLDKPEELQHKFDVWCTGPGLGYMSQIPTFNGIWEPNWKNRDVVKRYLSIRNLFSCEAHHDMLRRTLMLIEQYKITALKEEFPEIQKLQKPDFLDPQP